MIIYSKGKNEMVLVIYNVRQQSYNVFIHVQTNI